MNLKRFFGKNSREALNMAVSYTHLSSNYRN